jgi:hypothetical protein
VPHDMALADTQQRNWRGIKVTLGVYFGVAFILLLLLPEALVAGVPALAGFGRLLEHLIPGVARIADVSPFPAAMRVCLTVMWLALPLAAYRIGRVWSFPPRLEYLRKSDQWFLAGIVWLFAAGSLLFILIFFDVSRAEIMERGGRGGWMVRLMTQERLGAALFLPTWFCIVAGCSGVAVRITKLAAASRPTPTKP